MGRLTAHSIRKLATDKKAKIADGGGLYLFIDKRDQEYWRWHFLFSLHGRRGEMAIGPLRDFSLADAREIAAQSRALVRRGINPIRARKEERQREFGVTFGECADDWVEQKVAALRSAKTQSMLRRDVAVVMAKLRPVPVAHINVEDILKLLSPIWKESIDKGRRLREKLEAILDFATAKGLRSGENPARWRGHLQHLLPSPPKLEKQRHPAMAYKDVPAFITKLRTTNSVSARALEFCILTAARTMEVVGAEWSEIDMDERLWVIPKERMKSGREHRVPLSAAAMNILKQFAEIRADQFVFPSRTVGKRLSHDSLAAALARENVEGATVHGFRSSFRDWAGDCTGYPREVAEAALAHAVGDEVERAYRRSDALEKRRELMNQWADFIG